MAIEAPVINLAVEGLSDEIVLLKILRFVGINNVISRPHHGKSYLLERVLKFNEAAKFSNWLLVIDLDQDAECAPGYIKTLLPVISEGMLIRIPVRSIETWIMADRERFAEFLKIPIENIPLNPEIENHPKIALLNLVKRSRRRALKDDMLPSVNGGRKVGPGYSTRIAEYMASWRPEVAAANSDSLRRCIEALRNWELIGA